MTKQLTEKKDLLPENIDLFAEHAGQGLESVDSSQQIIPRIKLLQPLSPEVINDEKEGGVDGAQSGMFYNTVTQKLYDKGLRIVPIDLKISLMEWYLRSDKENSGIIRDLSDQLHLYDLAEYSEDHSCKLSKDGNQLVRSWDVLAFIIEDDGSFSPVIFSFPSTQFQKGKRLFSDLAQFKVKTSKGYITPATFAHLYSINAIKEKSANNNTYMGYSIKRLGFITDLDNGSEIYYLAKSFYDSYKSGEHQVASAEVEQTSFVESDEDPM